ncbi:preprotein translocase subunit YajC [Nocardioides coralli]|uniref:preprotein translocase subunit YajC n=1 Tax=Nocardioides coralli TaxID=2872154 RepID=UPI001CA441B5|nr:preprotein translocase subunit YajC [Nocardioides coralli]QZY30484.1 preprotein translocase subunit YajC [Nocardioides coralli]
MEQFVSLLPLIGIALLFWLLIIRPASRRQKALSRLQASLEPGNRVMMSSGIYGTVEQIDDDRVHLRVADGVTLQVARGAINTVVPADSTGTVDPQ